MNIVESGMAVCGSCILRAFVTAVGVPCVSNVICTSVSPLASPLILSCQPLSRTTTPTTAPASATRDDTILAEHATDDTTRPASATPDETILAEHTTNDTTRHAIATPDETILAEHTTHDTTMPAPIVPAARAMPPPGRHTTDETVADGGAMAGDTTGATTCSTVPTRSDTISANHDNTVMMAPAPNDRSTAHSATREQGDRPLFASTMTTPRSANADDTILAETVPGDITAPVSASERERRDTPSADAHTTDERASRQEYSEPGKAGEAQDPAIRQVLAYLAEHPQTKQAEVAGAPGMTVRSIQRKLATWKRQQPGAPQE